MKTMSKSNEASSRSQEETDAQNHVIWKSMQCTMM